MKQAKARTASDFELVTMVRAGDETAGQKLAERHIELIGKIASRYFLAGGGKEDVIAEGLVGFTRAIHDFNPDHGTPFVSFAATCAERQIQTAVKQANRHKHTPLNDSRSLSEPAAAGRNGHGSLPLEEVAGGSPSTESRVIELDRWRRLRKCQDENLTRNEKVSSIGLMVGASHLEIANALGGPEKIKAIDNALQRAKRKLARAIDKEAA